MRRGALAVSLVTTLALVGPTQFARADTGTIYRCATDDRGTVYSDRPCAEDAEPVVLDDRLSVIDSADGLAMIAESNAAFLESRRAERDARREAETRRREEERARRQRMPPMVVPVPVFVDPRPAVGAITRPVPERTERLQQRGSRPRPATDERRRPISALSGRQLGARRDIDDDG
jgi:hypothetical protein